MGKGKLTYSDGKVYEGEFMYGKKYGWGKMTYPDGDIYEGIWEGWFIQGHIKISYKNGKIYEGDSELLAPKGKGKITIKIKCDDLKLDIGYLTKRIIHPEKVQEGEPCYELIFEGEMDNLIPVNGRLYIKNIFRYDGSWTHGLPDGKGIFFNAASNTIEDHYYVDGDRIFRKNELSNDETRKKNRKTTHKRSKITDISEEGSKDNMQEGSKDNTQEGSKDNTQEGTKIIDISEEDVI